MASTLTILVLIGFASTFFGWAGADVDAAAGAFAVAGAGVPERLGSALIVRSLPCVSTRATGNSANLASRAAGRRDLASAKRALTAGEVAVLRVQLYYGKAKKVNNSDDG